MVPLLLTDLARKVGPSIEFLEGGREFGTTELLARSYPEFFIGGVGLRHGMGIRIRPAKPSPGCMPVAS